MKGGGLDETGVARWLSGLDIAMKEPMRFSRIGSGHSNLTYRVVDRDGSSLILRRQPWGDVLESAHDVEREHRILTALEETEVPTPAIYGLCTDPSVTDAPIMAMEYVDARVVDDMDAAEAVPHDIRANLGASMARTLARIHEVDLEARGLDSLASQRPYAERQIRRWRTQWERSATRELPLVEQVADRLEQSIPRQRQTTLVHGDFHMLNVLTDHSTAEVTAVLDWELCTLGDPLADIGSTLAYWTEPTDDPIIGFAGPTLDGYPRRDEMLQYYATASGRDVEDVWFWYALGLWKIAIITEGVYRRAIDDPRNASAEGLVEPNVVPALLTRASDAVSALGG